jgi:hypothetical protein
MNRGMTIRTDLTPGDHILRCELLEATADPGGGHEFRIISVMRYVPLLTTSSLSQLLSSYFLDFLLIDWCYGKEGKELM